MRSIKCHMCGELLTAPYFYQGRTYGYSCIKKVNPAVKKRSSKSEWVIADSHNFDTNKGKQLVTAAFQGRTYRFFLFKDNSKGYYSMGAAIVGKDHHIYVDLSVFKKNSPSPAGVGANLKTS